VTGADEDETRGDKTRDARAEQPSIGCGAAWILPSGLLGGVCRIQGHRGCHIAHE
jgi:hypothetical protein